MVKLSFNPTILLALALMAVIVMMILPMPAFILDLGLAISFGLAILIFTITLFVERPLDFSSFPTVLLASLMLRLSLNISSTKLIIGQGHTGTGAAGGVIEGFASFVMGGSVFLGLVVFGVLLIVNFMVITKGATRMAEVGARFALDAMPGKQLAIDSDMSAGAIDHAEAKARRERDQQETTFFGSLDGASKFVKGDAVAGLLITLLNFVMGLIMGAAVQGMPLSQAFETYAILTVGDGLVSQIPAVIISISAALLLARGGAIGSTDITLFAQLGRHPAALLTVGLLMLLFGLVPGLPLVPFSLGGVTLIAAAWYMQKKQKQEQQQSETVTEEHEVEASEETMADILDLDDIHVQFSPDLVEMVLDPGTGLDARIRNMRTHVAQEFGLVMPEIRLTDDSSLPAGSYRINIHGVEQAKGVLHPGRMLALVDGSDVARSTDVVQEPVYGAPAIWIDRDAQEGAALSGQTVVSPCEVLATHLLECLRKNLSRLLTFKSLQRLLDELVNLSDPKRAEANRRLLDELLPDKVPLDVLHSVLRLLLAEQVSIRNLPIIVETIAKARPIHSSPEATCEFVRQALGFQLISGLKRADGTIPLIQLAPEWEQTFSTYQLDAEQGVANIALPPELFSKLVMSVADQVSEQTERGIHPAIVTSTQRRRFLRTIISARGITAPVLSFEEIGTEAVPSIVGVAAA
ncbi:MAG: flagellar biosynthesis protein FlhA [Planktotalea sp.]|uniref:flagellar biosynthesis protein FlhA n=1 Tax=Planktotalea sp. TaxID=2029877 RepID=UPI003C715E2F